MAKNTLYDKVWDAHVVTRLPTGQYQLFIGLHLTHEVTTPQAFDMLTERGLGVAYLDRTVATVDHIIPTDDQARPYADGQAEAMMAALEANAKRHNASSSSTSRPVARVSCTSSGPSSAWSTPG